MKLDVSSGFLSSLKGSRFQMNRREILSSGFLGLIAMVWLLSSILKMGAKLQYAKSDLLPVVLKFAPYQLV